MRASLDSIPWTRGLILAAWDRSLVCVLSPTHCAANTSRAHLPGVIMPLTKHPRKYNGGSEKITESSSCLIFRTMLLGVLRRMITPCELVKLLCQRQGQRKRVSSLPSPSLLSFNFLQLIPPTPLYH